MMEENFVLDKLLGDRRNVRVMGTTKTGAVNGESCKKYTLNDALEFAG